MAKTANQNQIVLDRAQKALAAQSANLVKVATDLQGLVATSEGVVQKIEDLTAQAAELEAANATKRREADAELKLRTKEDRTGVLTELLKEGKLANITQAEVDSLRAELAAKLAADDKDQKVAVAVALSAAKRDSDAVMAGVVADNKVAAAQKDAQITMQADKITFLGTQVAQLQGQIDADRAARLEIAKAESQRQGVVVNNGK